jgi:DNA uptake protein ComE-like DNA-binding protein
VARVLERRAKRQAARELMTKDPAMARELGIGRPDLHMGYDDGGLVDINAATPESLSQACGIALGRAREIVAAREARGGTYFSIGEVLMDVALPPGEDEALREHGIV